MLFFGVCSPFVPRSQSAKTLQSPRRFYPDRTRCLWFTLVKRNFWIVRFLKTFIFLPPSLGSGLNDGQWHAIRLVAKENFAMLTIDGDEASAVRSTSPLTINTGGTYHLGGKGSTQHHHHRSDKNNTPSHLHLHSSPFRHIPLRCPSGRRGRNESIRCPLC